MNALSVAVVAGALVFVSIYFTFEYWYDRVGGALGKETEDLFEIYKDLFSTKTVERVRQEQIALSVGLSLLFFFFMWPEILFSIPFCIFVFWVSWKLPKLFLKNLIKPRRTLEFSIQMVDALTLMANGLKSGLNIPQTLQIVVDEMPNPIKQEFNLVLSENRVGKSLEEAFENLGRRIDSEDVSMFVTSVNILSETGGNIAETFQNITKTIRERLKLQNKISAMTAQGMTSAVIVGMLPWGIAVMLYLADPEKVRPLFTTPIGWGLLLLVVILEALGFFVILKIVKIRV